MHAIRPSVLAVQGAMQALAQKGTACAVCGATQQLGRSQHQNGTTWLRRCFAGQGDEVATGPQSGYNDREEASILSESEGQRMQDATNAKRAAEQAGSISNLSKKELADALTGESREAAAVRRVTLMQPNVF